MLVAAFIVVSIFPARLSSASVVAKFETLQTESGIFRAVAVCIMQDRRGFLWFCTADGLFRYDGYNAVQFRNGPRANSISSNDVRWAIEDRDGFIWIATFGGGLDRYDPSTGRFDSFRHDPANPKSIPDDHVQRVIEDSEGVIWVGTWDEGLASFDRASGEFQRYRHDPEDRTSLSDDRVRTLLEDRSGRLWIGTWGGGLNLMTDDGFVHYRNDPADPSSISGDQVRAMIESASGAMWIGTFEKGLNRLDPSTGTFERFRASDDPRSLSNDSVFALHEDRKGRLWVGTFSGGMSRFDPASHTFTRFQSDPSVSYTLSGDFVGSIFEDTAGIVWIGTGSGVNRFRPSSEAFELYRHDPSMPSSLPSDKVYAVAQGKGDSIWIGTFGGGLGLLDVPSGEFEVMRHDPSNAASITQDDIQAVLEDSYGDLWVGTNGAGLNRRPAGRRGFVRYRHDPADPTSLGNDQVRSIIETRDHRILIGVFEGGVGYHDPSTDAFRWFRNDPSDPASLSDDHVETVFEDSVGDLWVGTWGGGLNRHVAGESGFERFQYAPDQPQSLGDNRVKEIFEDSRGRLWIGTDGGGLNLFDRRHRTFRRYGKREGLPSNAVYGVLEDDAGNLWIVSQFAVSRFDPDTLEVRTYDASDGLQSADFNAGATLRARDGRFYVGGSGGLSAFRPSEIDYNRHVPPIVLTSIRIGDEPLVSTKPVSELRELRLDDDDDVITIEFAALDFSDPARNRYAYQLEGLSPRWHDLGDRRSITFTDLPPRHYTLHVLGSNNHGVWNEQGVALRLTIIPPFWATVWFRILAILSIIGVALLGMAVRTRSIQDRNRMLREEIKERRRIESALRDSQQRFSKAFNYSPDAITISRVSDGVFIEVNESFERISGFSRDAAVGASSVDLGLWLPGERERMMETIRERGELRNFETRIVVKGGDARDCLIAGDVIDLEGEKCLVAITRDVTELRRASRLREELIGELEAKNAELERFTYTVSHDLKSPIITIRGFLGLLERDAKAGDLEKLEKDIVQIAAATDKMHRLLDDLLELSRVGRVVNPPEDVALNPLIDDALGILMGSISDRRIDVVVQSGLPTVFGDRVRLLEVFQNLIENALKFMGDQTEPRIEIGARRSDKNVVCWVIDNGVGIDQKYSERIFGLFERLQSSGTGTGIGLTLVRRILELHGGRIWVESTPGHGSAFFFTLPAPPDTREKTGSDEQIG